MGYKLSILPISEILDVVNKVVFPVYSKMSDDKDRLISAFKKTILVVSLPIIFLSIFIFFLPKEFFVFVLGSNWGEVSTIIKILVIYGMLRAISGITTSLFLSLGKQNFVAGMTFTRLFVLIITIIPLTAYFGIVGASFSALLSVLVEIPFIIFFLWITFRPFTYMR